MYSKRLTLFVLSAICGVNTQFDLGDVCETRDGRAGICKYEQTCKYAIELKAQERHPTECSYDGKTLIACCPEDYTTGIISRFFVGTEGVIANSNLTCHYDGYLPMMCCPTAKDIQPPEPKGCPPLPNIRTPNFEKPRYKYAWEQCVANERYVNICEQTSQGYRRSYNCSVPFDTQRISGGEPAPLMEFAHMAILGCDSGISTENKIAWVGGGSLISSKFILTAGHVLITPIGKVRYAFLGGLDKTNIREGNLLGVTQLIPHNEYTPASKKHDIALVKLNTPITFSKFIRPACLPLPGIDPENEYRIIAGWGETIYKKQSTNLLQKAVITVVSGAECKRALSWPGFVWNDNSMICAKGQKSLFGTTDSCQGDSGGPLMYRVQNKNFDCNYVVDGVVSWGGKCGNGEPSSYTRVSAYLDWIVDTVWPHELVEDIVFPDRFGGSGQLEGGFQYRSGPSR